MRVDGADTSEDLRLLRRAAHRLVMRWALLLGVCTALTLAGLGLVVYSVAAHLHLYPILGSLWFLAGGCYLLIQLAPRSGPPLPDTTGVDGALSERWSDWVEGVTGERLPVRFTETPLVAVDVDGALVIGIQFVAGLSVPELAVMVREAWRRESLDREPGLRLATRLAYGALGRGLHARSDARFGRWLVGLLDPSLEALRHARSRASEGRWASDGAAQVVPRIELAVEAFDHVHEAWLEPARALGIGHLSPYSGVVWFLAAAESEGRLCPRTDAALADPTPVLHGDLGVGLEEAMVEHRARSTDQHGDLIAWTDHPGAVSLKQWRSVLADGLVDAGVLAGRPVSASLADYLDAMAAAGSVASDTARQVAGAAASVHLVETGTVRPVWVWPRGTVLVRAPADNDEFATLDPVAAAEEMEDPRSLLAWLASYGVDAVEPVWLDGGIGPGPERPIMAFNATGGLRRLRIVLTDRALHGVRGATRLREGYRVLVDGPLAPLDATMEAIAAGEPVDEHIWMPWTDVVRARLVPGILRRCWLLDLHAAGSRRVHLVLQGDVRMEERALRALLGDRLLVRWSYQSPWLRVVRLLIRWSCVVIGGLGLLVAGFGLARPPAGTTWVDWVEFGAVALAVTAIAALPDGVAILRERRHARRSRRAWPWQLSPSPDSTR